MAVPGVFVNLLEKHEVLTDKKTKKAETNSIKKNDYVAPAGHISFMKHGLDDEPLESGNHWIKMYDDGYTFRGDRDAAIRGVFKLRRMKKFWKAAELLSPTRHSDSEVLCLPQFWPQQEESCLPWT